MERGWWNVPVPVQTGRTRLYVNNTVQAARVLLNEWPVEPGKKHLAARKAVLKALQNLAETKNNARARTAFREAAKEADILRE